MNRSKERRDKSVLSRLAIFVLLPALLGSGLGYGISSYRASLARDILSPYKTPELIGERIDRRRVAYSFIEKPTDLDFGEVDNFKRYQAEWDLVNSGRGPLEMEMVAQDCDVIYNGVPFGNNQTLEGTTSVRIAMSWVVTDSGPTFSRKFELKTNDGLPERRTLTFQVQGTVNPVFELDRTSVNFDESADSASSQTIRLICFRTRSLQIQRTGFSDESLDQRFDVQVREVEDWSDYQGERNPGSVFDIVVNRKPGLGELPAAEGFLELETDLEGYEELKIQIRDRAQP